MPILKSGSKRRSRADLSAQMISAPLADFRHTMHIGRGGDAFGDTSFLSTPSEAPAQIQVVQNKNGVLARTFRGSKRSVQENNRDSASLIYSNSDLDTGLHQPRSSSSSFSGTNRHDRESISDENHDRYFEEAGDLPEFSVPPAGGMKHGESMLSFHVDLGPSMLGEVLGVMDLNCRDQNGRGQENCWDGKVPRLLHDSSKSKLGSKDEKKHGTNNHSTRGATPRVMSTYSTTSVPAHNTTPVSKYNGTTEAPNRALSDKTTPVATYHDPYSAIPVAKYNISPSTTKTASSEHTYSTTSVTTNRTTPAPAYKIAQANKYNVTYNTTTSATNNIRPSSTYNSTYNATPASTHNSKPGTTYNDTYNTTPAATNSIKPSSTYNDTYKTTPVATNNIRPSSTYNSTHNTTSVATYNSRPGATNNGTYKTTPAATKSIRPLSTYNSTYNTTPESTHNSKPGATYNGTYKTTPAATKSIRPSSTYNSTYNATPGAIYDTYTATSLDTNNKRPSSTYNATYNTTPDSTLNSGPGATYNNTYSATDLATYDATHKATSAFRYSTTQNAIFRATHNLTPYGATRSSTQNTPCIASIASIDDDLLFMDEDEDDDEIRL